MFSHAELLSHSCSDCADRNDFVAPAELDIDFAQGLQGDCLWFKLAYAWLDRPFKRELTKYENRGYAMLQREGIGSILADGSESSFEWMVPSQDGSESLCSLDNKRRLTKFSGGTSSAATFTILKKWMAECESNHELCHTKNQNHQHLEGIRFLRIRDKCVFLEEGVVPARYACLSHCWGTVPNLLKTTQENKCVHMDEGLSIPDLPKTYRDTVAVCKELGINHLWIDSLCIVQDSSQDWNEQASRMADVYQNAYVTLAAVAARDSTEGLFNDISHRLSSVPLPQYPWIHIRRRPQLPSSRNKVMDLNSNDGHALYRRGWTFQELGLSPRVIHYGRNDIIWHCQSRSSREGDPDGTMNMPHLLSFNWTKGSKIPVQRLWYSIVESFSWRSLTFDKDKLPAIAAFASQIQAQDRKKRYIHGLWEDSLRIDLLWSVYEWKSDQHSPGPSSGLESRSLPTWSWTSVTTATASVMWIGIPELDLCEELPHTKIVKVAYETRGPPLLGDAIEAHIVIQAPIFKLCDIHLILGFTETAQNNHDELAWYAPCWDTVLDATEYGKQCTEALAIPLITINRRIVSKFGQRFINSLLVVETSEVRKYRRVGVATIAAQADFANVPRNSEKEKMENGVEREKSHERFLQIMEQMEKRTITLT